MAVITSSFSTGSVIGPALSGAIADPVGQYNLTIASKLIMWCVCVRVCVWGGAGENLHPLALDLNLFLHYACLYS